MQKDSSKDKWTCPNDRHLQLRAKLNAGWSYHTEKKTTVAESKTNQLSESELIAIQKVLQRSEMLERIEQERVSKLVERLENLKRHASQSIVAEKSSNRCAICGDYFYLLRSTPNSCNICHKLLCSKCCIDTTISSDDLSLNRGINNRSYLGSTSLNQQTMWLCRICSEQRELWKKSGAWFFKRFPSYLTPSSLKSYGSVASTLSEPPQKSKDLNKYSTIMSTTTSAHTTGTGASSLSPGGNKDQLHNQVSFSLPTTPNKQKFNSPSSAATSPGHKTWTRESKQEPHQSHQHQKPSTNCISFKGSQRQDNSDSSSDFDEHTHEQPTSSNNSDTTASEFNHQTALSLLSSTPPPPTASNPNISNIFIPSSINNFSISNYPTCNTNFQTFTFINNKTTSGNSPSPMTTPNSLSNNNNIANNHSNSGSLSSAPNSPTSRNSNTSSPVSLKTTSLSTATHDTTVTTPPSTTSTSTTSTTTTAAKTPKGLRRSFRKPKLLEWCSNQFSFDVNANEKANKLSSSSPSTPLIKSKKKHGSKSQLANDYN